MSYDIIIGRDKSDKEKFGKRGLVHLGKTYVTMGAYTSLSNNIYMDIARSHVILVAGKRGCLTGDTLVFTNKGYKKIEDFKEKEDKILSFNKEKKEFEWEKAELLKYPVKNENLLKIELKDGRIINLTKEHPLLVTTGKGLLSLSWIEARNLKEGDNLLSVKEKDKNITPIEIRNITEISGIKEVYDLSVDKNHSFIANGIISHNSGKSYTLGVLAEELSNLPPETSGNIASLIFDTMGIFWTMKFKNDKDKYLLKDWGLETKNLPVKIYAPFGKMKEYKDKNIPVDSAFALKPSELEAEDWIIAFNLEMTSPAAVAIQKAITKLKDTNFTIKEIISQIEKEEKVSNEHKNTAISLFEAAESWGIFSTEKEGTEITDLIEPGKTTIIDLSVYSSLGAFNVRGLAIGLISKKLFKERIDARKKEEIQSINHGIDYLSYTPKRDTPLVWMFIDEAHEFLPKEGKTPATEALVQILREGRQPGLSLVLATQQPGEIHKDVLTQSDIVISHRVTSEPDIKALNTMMQSYLLESINKSMNNLPSLKGSAIILDDNSERIYPVRIKPRFTWHGGEAPTAIKADSDFLKENS